MKLTYWVAKCINDQHSSFDIRAKTKKGVLAEIELLKAGRSWHEFEEPKKVTVNYEDGFDLIKLCLDTCGGWWE